MYMVYLTLECDNETTVDLLITVFIIFLGTHESNRPVQTNESQVKYSYHRSN